MAQTVPGLTAPGCLNSLPCLLNFSRESLLLESRILFHKPLLTGHVALILQNWEIQIAPLVLPLFPLFDPSLGSLPTSGFFYALLLFGHLHMHFFSPPICTSQQILWLSGHFLLMALQFLRNKISPSLSWPGVFLLNLQPCMVFSTL